MLYMMTGYAPGFPYMFALALAAITFHTNFEGGSIGKVEPVATNHWRCPVVGEADQDKRNRQASWYYFRVDGASGQTVTLDLVDLVGEYNYKPGTHAVTRGTRPVFSYDDQAGALRRGKPPADDTEKRLRIRFTARGGRVWIAHVPPYTDRHLQALLKDARGSGRAQVSTAARLWMDDRCR